MFKFTELSELDLELAEKWISLAKVLEINVVTPFEIVTKNTSFAYAVLIKDFAASDIGKGCLFRAYKKEDYDKSEKLSDVATENGYMLVNVAECGVETFNLTTAREAWLESCCYVGDSANKPNWYTGKYCR